MRKLLLLCAFALSAFYVGAQSCTIIYVSTDGESDNPGSKDSPKDIVSAFADAQENVILRLAAGTYNLDAPLEILANGVRIEGGFIADEDWTKTSLAGATTIHRTANSPQGPAFMQRLVAIVAIGKSGFSMHDVTITTANGTSPGMSTYGVYLSACSNYKFVRCQILPGNGANGQSGEPGLAGSNGASGANGGGGSCDGGECTFSSGWAGGAGGNGGVGGGGASGGPGGPAINGQNDPGVGSSAIGRNGGGGGGGRQNCTFCDNGPGNGAGGGGGGGQGGTAGTGGTGGGGSFAVYARQNGANGQFIDCNVDAGNAGQGGAGGAGGAGAQGGNGGNGATICTSEIGAGGNGGAGGAGAAGGNGGNGADGIAGALYLASGTDFSTASANFDLAEMPEIWVTYAACFGNRVYVSDETIAEGNGVTTWSFGSNAMPLTGTNNPQDVIFMANGNYTISHGAHTYTDFVYYCCSSVSVEELMYNEIMLYPNPTNGLINIELGVEVANLDVRIIDAMGREVSSQTHNNVSAVQTQLPAQNGIYLIYMTVNDQVIVKRVVKN